MRELLCVLLVGLLSVGMWAAGQNSLVAARVNGLEKNTEYMTLLSRQNGLKVKEDSLLKRVEQVRELFINRSEREGVRDSILKLEGEIFDVRNELGKAALKINKIEQDFIMRNLDDGDRKSSQSVVLPDSLTDLMDNGGELHSITDSRLFKRLLPKDDFDKLVDAKSKEQVVFNYMRIYKTNYDMLLDISEKYNNVDNQADADSLLNRFNHTKRRNAIVADSVSSIWSRVYDHKTYAYNYVLDGLHRASVINTYEEQSRELLYREAELVGTVMSIDVAMYEPQKKLLTEYEKNFAQVLGIPNVVDSLEKSYQRILNSKFSSKTIEIEERLFIDYQDFAKHTPPIYNQENPIPELVVYPKGVIYRVTVGAFQRAQPISLFKGVAPVGYLKMDGQTSYFIGGYQKLSEVLSAVVELKKMGFRAPKAVVWNNGEYRVLDEDESARYRVEIVGEDTPQIRELIVQVIEEVGVKLETSRSDGRFLVGVFVTVKNAQLFVENMSEKNRSVTVKIVEL